MILGQLLHALQSSVLDPDSGRFLDPDSGGFEDKNLEQLSNFSIISDGVKK